MKLKLPTLQDTMAHIPKQNIYRVPTPITPEWLSRVYYNTHWWTKFFRPRFMERIGWRCEVANCTRQATQIHHFNYGRLFCEEREDVIGVCRDHHVWLHSRQWAKAANDNNPQAEFEFVMPNEDMVANDNRPQVPRRVKTTKAS